MYPVGRATGLLSVVDPQIGQAPLTIDGGETSEARARGGGGGGGMLLLLLGSSSSPLSRVRDVS